MSDLNRAASPLPLARTGEVLPLTVRVNEACRLTGIGRSKLYMLINEGHIEIIKVGTMTLIPVRSLIKFLGVEAG